MSALTSSRVRRCASCTITQKLRDSIADSHSRLRPCRQSRTNLQGPSFPTPLRRTHMKLFLWGGTREPNTKRIPSSGEH